MSFLFFVAATWRIAALLSETKPSAWPLTENDEASGLAGAEFPTQRFDARQRRATRLPWCCACHRLDQTLVYGREYAVANVAMSLAGKRRPRRPGRARSRSPAIRADSRAPPARDRRRPRARCSLGAAHNPRSLRARFPRTARSAGKPLKITLTRRHACSRRRTTERLRPALTELCERPVTGL